MRPSFIALALLGAAAAPVYAQGVRSAPPAPQAVRIPGVSAAGNAVLTRMQGKVDPAGPALMREDAAVRQQMQAVLAAPTIDVARLTTAMQRAQAVAAKARAMNDSHLLEVVRALPAADRAPFLRAIVQQQAQRAAAPPPPAR